MQALLFPGLFQAPRAKMHRDGEKLQASDSIIYYSSIPFFVKQFFCTGRKVPSAGRIRAARTALFPRIMRGRPSRQESRTPRTDMAARTGAPSL